MPWSARLAVGLFAAFSLLTSWSAPAGSALPAEAFGSMPAESDPVLSPDGHWLAWLDRKEPKPRHPDLESEPSESYA
jgi:hypothetical protein